MESEFKDVEKLIYAKDLYDDEGDYLYYFLNKMLESCCISNFEVPL
jgi:hypothetical protein